MTVLAMLKDVAVYPFRGAGPVMLIIGTALCFMPFLAGFAPVIGFMAVVAGYMYLGAFYLQVIGQTVSDNDEIPDWPSLSNVISDLLLPNIRMAVAGVVAMVPLIAQAFLTEGAEFALEFDSPAAIPGLACMAFYLPMALLNAAVYETVASVLPHRVFPAIYRCMPSYLISSSFFFVIMMAEEFVSDWSERVPYVSWLALAFVSFYFLVIQGRMIGLIYRRSEQAIVA